jgi:hypothetical protein
MYDIWMGPQAAAKLNLIAEINLKVHHALYYRLIQNKKAAP